MIVVVLMIMVVLMVVMIMNAPRLVIVIIGMPGEVQTRTHYGREQIAQSGQPCARERTNIVNVQGCA